MAAKVLRSVSIPGSITGRSSSIFLPPSKWSLFPWARSSEETEEASSEEQSKKQDEAWEQAGLNALAFLLLFVAGCIVVAVYCVLEPFLHPLLWAVLVGTLLHPFKHRATSTINTWLSYLEASNIPLSVGVVFSPAFVFDWLSQMFENYVRLYWRQLALSVLGMVCLTVAYVLSLPGHLIRGTAWVVGGLQVASDVMEQTVYMQLVTLALGFVVLLVLVVRSSRSLPTKVLSTSLWFIAIFNITSYVLGATIALTAVLVLFAAAVGVSAWEWHCYGEGGRRGAREKGTDVPEESAIDKTTVRLDRTEVGEEGGSGGRVTERSESTLAEFPPGVDEPDRKYRRVPVKESEKKANYVFLVLSAAVVVMLLWKYPLFHLLIIPLALWSAIKFIISRALVQGSSARQMTSYRSSVEGWIHARSSLLFPTPMPTLFRMFVSLDRRVLRVIRGTIDSSVSAFIILGLMVLGVGVAVFLLFQIQVELTHYVTMTVNVWERMVASSPQLQEWTGMAKNETFKDTFGAFANQGYEYGRAWLAGQLHSLVSDSSGNTSVVEQRVLDLYDELYRWYVLKNTTTLDLTLQRDPAAITDDDDMFWSELSVLITTNLETILSVLSSLWSILSENVMVAFSLLYALLQLLFSGGSAVLNLLVFVTTLFYLLCYSERNYRPVKWVMDALPQLAQGEGKGEFAEAFSRAIRSVFHASLRRAVFYGLYTWLIHTVFGLPVSVLPSVLAAIVGAIPVVGPYWIAVPAVLELWLVEGKLVVALTLTALALLPAMFVDSLIYGEIEGGGHPYLTGLAVAGGIYFAGLEGALIGPILLCFYSQITAPVP